VRQHKDILPVQAAVCHGHIAGGWGVVKAYTSLQEESGPLVTPRALYLFFDRLNNNTFVDQNQGDSISTQASVYVSNGNGSENGRRKNSDGRQGRESSRQMAPPRGF
jgi:hypothetical protein